MIIGLYHRNAPRVPLRVTGDADEVEIEFVVDTAFDGDISLPEELLRRLGAKTHKAETRMMANGMVLRCLIYTVELEWLEGVRSVEALSLANRPIIGTLLLEGCHLDIEATEGGEVIIESLG